MKLQEYELRRLGQQAVDWHDDIRDLANNGKYAHPIVSAVPAWKADNGEMAFYDGVAGGGLPGKRIYVRLSSAWSVFAVSPFSGIPGGTEGSVQFNSSNAFGGDEIIKWSQPNSVLTISPNSSGSITMLLLKNSAAIAVGNTSSGVKLGFGFGVQTDNATIEAIRFQDYSTNGNSTSLLRFRAQNSTSLNSVLTLGSNVNNMFALFGGDGRATNASVEVQGNCLIGSAASVVGFTVPSNGLYSQGAIYINANNTNPSFSNTFFYCRDNDGSIGPGAMGIQFEGRPSNSVPVTIVMGNTARQDIARVQLNKLDSGVGSPNRANLALFMTDVRYVGHVSVEKTALTTPAQLEDTEFIVGILPSTTNPGPISYDCRYGSSLALTNHRSTIFTATSLNVLAGATSSIVNAATVFIAGPPLVMGTNLTVTNRYALWVGTGPVRIDGDVITGAATTATKANGVFFTTTAIGVASNDASEVTLIRSIIGTTSLVANTLSDGRTIRLQAKGYFNTTTTAGTAIFSVYLGGTALLTTSNQTITSSMSSGGWTTEALITCQTTGGAGTLFCQGRFDPQSSSVATQNWQMVGSSTVVMNTTQSNVLELRYQWGTANAGLQLFATNIVGELLN